MQPFEALHRGIRPAAGDPPRLLNKEEEFSATLNVSLRLTVLGQKNTHFQHELSTTVTVLFLPLISLYSFEENRRHDTVETSIFSSH